MNQVRFSGWDGSHRKIISCMIRIEQLYIGNMIRFGTSNLKCQWIKVVNDKIKGANMLFETGLVEREWKVRMESKISDYMFHRIKMDMRWIVLILCKHHA